MRADCVLRKRPGGVGRGGDIGLGYDGPPLLRRSGVWEVAIAAGYAGYGLTLLGTLRAIRAKRGGWVWLGVASVAMGLTVGARPTYLPGGGGLVGTARTAAAFVAE